MHAKILDQCRFTYQHWSETQTWARILISNWSLQDPPTQWLFSCIYSRDLRESKTGSCSCSRVVVELYLSCLITSDASLSDGIVLIAGPNRKLCTTAAWYSVTYLTYYPHAYPQHTQWLLNNPIENWDSFNLLIAYPNCWTTPFKLPSAYPLPLTAERPHSTSAVLYRYRHSKIHVLPGITSCRLMKDNNQQVDSTCLLRMTWPKDVIDKWNNSDLKDAI